jgi:hypothetical protein
MNPAHATSTTFSALIWWVIPAVALVGAFAYVIWVSKFQDKFNNETNRSVSKFQDFQESFRDGKSMVQAEDSPVEPEGTGLTQDNRTAPDK